MARLTRPMAMFLLLWLPLSALAAIDVYQFASPQQQQRFYKLTHQLRCPKCQDQTIADSNAEIAHDMRAKVADMIRKGRTDDEIMKYFVDRYGIFVTYNPPVTMRTVWLWAGPLTVFLVGLFLVIRLVRRASRDADREDS